MTHIERLAALYDISVEDISGGAFEVDKKVCKICHVRKSKLDFYAYNGTTHPYCNSCENRKAKKNK